MLIGIQKLRKIQALPRLQFQLKVIVPRRRLKTDMKLLVVQVTMPHQYRILQNLLQLCNTDALLAFVILFLTLNSV